MLCQEAREHLSAYLDKELTADLSAAVRVHLDTCSDCRRLLGHLRATVELLGRLPVHAAPEGLARDVVREMERRSILESGATVEGQPHERTLAIQRARTWPRVLAIAATLLLAAGIGLFAWLGGRRGEAPSPMTGLARHETVYKETTGAGVDSLGDRPEPPVSVMDLARKAGDGLGEKLEWTEDAADDVVLGDVAVGDADGFADEMLARDEDSNVRLGVALAKAPTTGLGNVEDAAGQQTIFGNDTVVRSSPATQGLAWSYGAIHDKKVMLAWTGAATNGRVIEDLYAYKANGTRLHFDAGRAARGEVKKLAPPGAGTILTEAITRGGTEYAYRALGLGTTEGGPRMVQQVMNSVVEEQAAVDALAAVATRDNLLRADNQLVVHTRSRDEANKELERLFVGNGWQALAQDKAAQVPEGRPPAATGGAGAVDLGGKIAERHATAGGWYFLAGRNGEDTWIILTDRDNLSRFGSQLAQATAMTVGMDSSTHFHAISRLQRELHLYAITKDGEAYWDTETESLKHGRAWGRAAAEAATKDMNGLAKARPDDGGPASSLEAKRSGTSRLRASDPLAAAEGAGEAGQTRGKRTARPQADFSAGTGVRGAAMRPPAGPAVVPRSEPRAALAEVAETPSTAAPEPTTDDRRPDGRTDVAADAAAVVTADGGTVVTTPARFTRRGGPSVPPVLPRPAQGAKPPPIPAPEAERAPTAVTLTLREPDKPGGEPPKEPTPRDKREDDEAKRRSAEKRKKADAKAPEIAKRSPRATVSAAGLTVRQFLTLPENQILLIVRVRQVTADAEATADEPAATRQTAEPQQPAAH